MAERASIYLFFILLQFVLTVCSKGTIMGYYYDARRDMVSESYAKGAISFMKLNAVSQSQTRVLVADHEVLQSYLNTDVNIYLFLNETQVDNLESKKSAVLWLKTQLLTSYRHVKIKGVVVNCNRDSLLSTLKSIRLTLHNLNLHNRVKVSVTLSVSFLENMDKTELHKIIEFIKKEKSYIFLEINDGGDRYVQSFIKRATSILQYNDVSKVLVSKSLMKMKYQHTRKLTSVVEAAVITYPTTPITNPVTPTVVMIPAANPVTITPTNPVTTPGTIPSTANPVNSPLPIINPVTAPITVPGMQQPITNPVTTYPPPTGNVPITTPVITPVMPPVTLTNPPATIPGQTWCTAKNGASENALQGALDYACGLGEAECSMIQMGASCYNPNTLPNHASYAFNSYYQKNPSPTSCDFGGTAMLVNINPSTGSCIYPASSSSLASTSTPSTPTTIPPPTPTIIPPPTPTTIPPPTPTTIPPYTPTTIPPYTPTPIPPYTPTPTSSSGAVPIYGSPPTVLNTSNPASPTPVVYGSGTPPDVNTSMSVSISLRPFVGCIFLATSFITGKLIMDM